MNGLAWPITHGQGSRIVPRGMLSLPLIAALALTGSTAPARADLIINATFDSSITGSANASQIEAAINASIGNITSNVSSTKNVTVSLEFQSVNYGLGTSTSATYNVSYFDYYTKLAAVSTSAAQLTALASLGTPPTNENSVNPATGTNQITITAPEGRNLGFSTPGGATDPNNGSTFDTIIALNTSLTSPPNVSSADTYSLQSVATHEIDEALGIGGTGSTLGSGANSPAGDLDLYRYSAPGVRSYTTDPNAVSYFSIDGGNTVLSYFNQEAGADYADWSSDPQPAGYGPQVQDAFGTPGIGPLLLDSNELTAFNAIGYTLLSPAAVPEPTSFLMVGVGLALAAWTVRSRKLAKTPAHI